MRLCFFVKLFVLHLVLVLIDITKIVIFLFFFYIFFSFLDVLGQVGLVGPVGRVGGPLLHIPLLRARLITESEQGAGGSKKRKRGVFFSLEEVLGLVGPVGLVGKIGRVGVFPKGKR